MTGTVSPHTEIKFSFRNRRRRERRSTFWARPQVQPKLQEQGRSNQVSFGTSERRTSTDTEEGTLHRAQGPGAPAATPPSPPPVKKPRKKARQVCWLFCAVFLPPVARGRGRRPFPGIVAPCLGRYVSPLRESLVLN